MCNEIIRLPFMSFKFSMVFVCSECYAASLQHGISILSLMLFLFVTILGVAMNISLPKTAAVSEASKYYIHTMKTFSEKNPSPFLYKTIRPLQNADSIVALNTLYVMRFCLKLTINVIWGLVPHFGLSLLYLKLSFNLKNNRVILCAKIVD